MRIPRRALLLLLAAAAPAPRHEEWHDTARGRTLPVLIRLPAGPGPHPLLLISHGLGGSRDGLAYLGEAAAAAGFIALHLQHPGSDEAVWQGAARPLDAMRAAARQPEHGIARLLDARFAIDQAMARLPVDAARIAAAGHSYGAWSVQHWLGERMGRDAVAMPEPRIRAGIAISPVPPRGIAPAAAMAGLRTPLLHITGSRDTSPLDGTTPEDRLLPWQHTAPDIPAGLLWLDGADHMGFSGLPRYGETQHAKVAEVAIRFLRAMLLGDARARAWLLAGGPGTVQPPDRLTMRALG